MLSANSAVIQDILTHTSGSAPLPPFYCDFREDQKKDRRGSLSSLLVGPVSTPLFFRFLCGT